MMNCDIWSELKQSQISVCAVRKLDINYENLINIDLNFEFHSYIKEKPKRKIIVFQY